MTTTSPFFETNSTWTTPIPNGHPTISNSDDMITWLNAQQAGFSLNVRSYSVPLYVCEADTETVRLYQTSVSNDAVLTGVYADAPIPATAIPAGNDAYIQGTYRDGHLSIISFDGNTAYEFRRCRVYNETYPPPDGQQATKGYWRYVAKRFWDCTTDGVDQPYTGLGMVRVSPGPLCLGLIMKAERDAGAINHALLLGTTSALAGSAGVYPEVGPNNGHSTDPNAIQLGHRVRLKTSTDISGLSGTALAVATALRDYGAIMVINTGGGNSIYAESFSQGSDSDYGAWAGLVSLTGINVTDCEVVEPVPAGATGSVNTLAMFIA